MKNKLLSVILVLTTSTFYASNPSFAYEAADVVNDFLKLDKQSHLKKYGLIDHMTVVICVHANELNRAGSSSLLSDNYQDKLDFIETFRKGFVQRKQAGGEDMTAMSAAVVDRLIDRANEFMCPMLY